MKYTSLVIIVIAFILIYVNASFTVGDDDLVVITKFGQPVGKTYNVPGYYFKVPFFQKTHYFKKHIFKELDTLVIPTLDKKYLTIELETLWKINDAAIFYRHFNSNNSERKFIDAEVRKSTIETVASHNLNDQIFEIHKSAAVISTYRPYLDDEIKEKAKDKLSKAGINLVSIETKIIKQSDNP